MQRYKDKSREISQTTLSQKEELTEYKLADYVNKNFVWRLLVTLPTLDSLQNIHKILRKNKYRDEQLNTDLINFDKDFFQILHLLYYYVTINKDENVLVKYTLHTAVSLLTETISRLPINGANHANRPLEAYSKMLKLEQKIKQFNASVLLSDDDEDDAKIKLAIQAISEYLDDQFIALDRVFSVIYSKYIEYPDLMHTDSQCAVMHNILTKFCEDIKKLITMYPDHNFQRLLLAVDDIHTVDKNVILMTPQKPSYSSNAAIKKVLCHAAAPDATPTGIDENVKKSATFIAKVLKCHNSSYEKKIIFNTKVKQNSILEDLEQELIQRLGLDDLNEPKSKACKKLFRVTQDQESRLS